MKDIVGYVITLEREEDLVLVHLGLYGDGKEFKLKCKFWSSKIPL
jgi:hypothetical protein